MNNEAQQVPVHWKKEVRFENVHIRSLAVEKRVAYLRQILGARFERPLYVTPPARAKQRDSISRHELRPDKLPRHRPAFSPRSNQGVGIAHHFRF